MTKNIGNFFFDKFFQLWTANETFYNIFLLYIFAKMRRHDVPPNYRIREVFSIIEYFYKWIGLKQKGSQVSPNF
jgi:hypothetical protein